MTDPVTDVTANDPIPADEGASEPASGLEVGGAAASPLGPEEDPDGLTAGVVGLVAETLPPPALDPDDDPDDEEA